MYGRKFRHFLVGMYTVAQMIIVYQLFISYSRLWYKFASCVLVFGLREFYWLTVHSMKYSTGCLLLSIDKKLLLCHSSVKSPIENKLYVTLLPYRASCCRVLNTFFCTCFQVIIGCYLTLFCGTALLGSAIRAFT